MDYYSEFACWLECSAKPAPPIGSHEKVLSAIVRLILFPWDPPDISRPSAGWIHPRMLVPANDNREPRHDD